MRYDVVVAGGGPAGAATALRLAAAGRSVVLLERGRYDRPRVGETLAPAVQPLLRDLGVWDRFTALCPLPSWGTRSVWESPRPTEHSHLASGYGSGWHVDRCAFDRMLADAAGAAGARVCTGVSVASCRHTGTGWDVECVGGRRLTGRVLIDATGRRAGPGRGLGARRVVFDRLVAVAATWTDVDTIEERYLLVESTPDGWWYSAPLPGDALVGVLMTDADLCRRHDLTAAAQWRARLRAAPVTAGRVDHAGAPSAPWAHAAASHRLTRSGDPRPWLAVGDAALAVDPASGSGVVRALRTAAAAADTATFLIEQPGDGCDAEGVVAAYERARDRECTAYLVGRADLYGSVRRHVSPFWARRRLSGHGGPPAKPTND